MKIEASFLFLFFAGSIATAQPVNVKINTLSNRPEEVAIAIDPTNPDNMVAGANLRNVYRSTDGGKTWKEARLPRGTYGDPSLVFDPAGNVFYAHLLNTWEAIGVRRSSDKGATWEPLVRVRGESSDSARPGSLFKTSLQDKEWIAADLSDGPGRGNIYMAWTNFTKYGSRSPLDSSSIMFARSTDGGVTFEPYVRVSDRAGNAVDSDSTMEGAVPAAGPGGEVHLAWAGPEGIYFDKSTDGGVTFGEDRVISDMPGGWDIEVSGIYRANGMPVTTCDVSRSPYRGTVYVNWVDDKLGDYDVWLIRSTDGGATWSGRVRVNDDEPGNGRDQFFTWMAVDPVTGEIAIVFYDRRHYASDSTDVYLARSTDGGVTFRNERISTAAFLPSAFVFIGDYINVASYGGRIRPVWTRMDDGELSIYTALIDPTPSAIEPRTKPEKIWLGQNYPNPFGELSASGTDVTNISFTLSGDAEVTLKIFNVLGKEVTKIEEGRLDAGTYHRLFRAGNLPGGVYYYRLEMDEITMTRKMLLVR